MDTNLTFGNSTLRHSRGFDLGRTIIFMKICGLVSGGKDSIFTLKVAAELGHEVVCLANLYPGSDETEELDSYVYQTVGHRLVPLQGDAIGLPLVRSARVLFIERICRARHRHRGSGNRRRRGRATAVTNSGRTCGYRLRGCYYRFGIR
jgi:hypothetical protein